MRDTLVGDGGGAIGKALDPKYAREVRTCCYTIVILLEALVRRPDRRRGVIERPFGIGTGLNLAEALAIHGQAEESLATIEAAIATINCSKEFIHLPEALRVKGLILASAALHDNARAEEQLLASLQCACAQSALSWELRSATSLARLWRDHGRRDEAQALLAPVCDRFREGYATVDYRVAKALLHDLSVG